MHITQADCESDKVGVSSVLAVNFRCLVGRRSLRSLSPSGGGFAGVRVKWGHRTDTAEVQLPRALVAL